MLAKAHTSFKSICMLSQPDPEDVGLNPFPSCSSGNNLTLIYYWVRGKAFYKPVKVYYLECSGGRRYHLASWYSNDPKTG